MRRPSLSSAVLLVALAGCRSAAEPVRAAGACANSGEFAAFGCAEVSARVVGAAGQPLAGIRVGLSPPAADRAGLASGARDTGADGVAVVRAVRIAPAPAVAGPDTLSIYVVAYDPASAGVGVPARVRDSALVALAFARVGQVPTPREVRIALPGR